MSVAGLLANWPRIGLQVAWNVGGLQTTTPYWTDLTYLTQGSWTATGSGRQYELDAVTSGTMSWTLDNTDGKFDSLNTAGPYFGSIVPFRKAQLLATWPPTQNVLPQSLAKGSDLLNAKSGSGSLAVATVAAAPSGQTTAIAWTFPASGAASTSVGLGTTTGSFGTCDSNAVPLVGLRATAAGLSWTGSVYISALAGGTAGLTVQLRISWYGQDGVRLSTSDSTATTVPVQTSWVRATVTATAPANAVWARVSVFNSVTTSVSNTIYTTGWQFERAAAATAWADPGVTASLWTGYLERIKQRWKGAQGYADMAFVDSLAGLSKLTLSPSVLATLQALGPSRLHPLDEPAGSTTFRDLTAKHPALTVGNSTLGAGTVTAGAAVTGTGSNGSSGPVVTLVNAASTGFNQVGSFLALPAPNGPPSTGGWARLLAFRTTTVPSAGNIAALWWWGGAVGTPSQGGIYLDSGQGINASTTNAAGQQITVHNGAVSVCDGNWHIVQVVLFPDGKTLSINIDGAGAASGGSSFDCHSTGITTDNLGMNANPVNKSYLWGYSGDLALATELPTHLNPTFIDMATGFSTGWVGEASLTRAQRIVNLAGFPGTVAGLGTATLMGGLNVSNSDAVSALQVVGDSEGGQVYVDGGGTVTLAGRRWRYLHFTPDVVFGENTAGGELPYQGGVEVNLDPDHIYNTVTVTNQAGAGGVQAPDLTATNTASQQKYFASSLPRTINVQDPNEAAAATAYLSSQYAEPQPRISAVTVDPSAYPAMWPTLLQLGFGSRARLMRRPNNATAQTLETFLEQLAWKGDDTGRLTLAMQLSAASPYLGWWIVAPLHTTVHTAVNVGDTVITLDPLTGSSLNPAAGVLPAGTVLTLGYGDAVHTENVTVRSVAATVAGYTSVAVTLTAAVTHTHAVGAVVCEPLPGGYTMPASTLAGYPSSLDAGATVSATGPRVAY